MSSPPAVLRSVSTPTRRARAALLACATGFFLCAGGAAAHAEVARLFARAQPDAVVHNDLTTRGAGPDDFPATLHLADGRAQPCATRSELAAALERWLVAAALPAANFPTATP